ncbi:Ig-like domain-containing protein [Allokutzneria sp. NRRL B-24872]|uniref:L,D-transpeptidase n=1 Tax=Allokutzneria sp. NRRL B-24872 TaxID=1137961 RepID=UPI000A3CAECD
MVGDKGRSGRRWALVVLGCAALALTPALAACTGGGGTTTQGSTSTPEEAPKAPAKVAIAPADGAKDVPPGQEVKVGVTDGTLTEVTLTNNDGKAVAGKLSEDKRSWVPGEDLGFSKTYKWAGSAVGTDGKPVPLAGSFSTVKQGRMINISPNVVQGETYGIAMPIGLVFGQDVKDKASVERALKVTTEPATEGSWAWTHNDQVYWRPAEYWKPNTKVTLNAKLYGVSFGGNSFGKESITRSFSIGRARITVADNQTKHVIVTENGQQVADYPASLGKEHDRKLVTRNGKYWAMEKHRLKLMTNLAYEYENYPAPWAVRMSWNGEFIHANDSTRGSHGKANVSHGCINLTSARAKEFHDATLIGDPIEVTGAKIDIPTNGSDIWGAPYSNWKALSALGKG